MNASPPTDTRPVDIGAYRAWLFDLDGVLTKTADVHAAAWKQAFDEFLDNEAKRTKKAFAPFDTVADYARYVDGEPRADGVRNFLAARDIELHNGADDDAPDARTVIGIGNRKNELVLQVLRVSGVQAYAGAVTLVKALRAQTRFNRWKQHHLVGATVDAYRGPPLGSSIRELSGVCC